MIELVKYIFYYVFLMISGRFFFTLFFYKSYTPPSFGYSTTSKRQIAFQLDMGIVIISLVFLTIIINLLVASFSPEISFFTLIDFLKLVFSSSISSLFILLMLLFIYCIYSAVFELTTGSSPGKRFMEIRSVNTKFKKLTPVQVILRNAMKFISLLMSPIYIFIAYNDKKRRWAHDTLALSVVIDTQKIEVTT